MEHPLVLENDSLLNLNHEDGVVFGQELWIVCGLVGHRANSEVPIRHARIIHFDSKKSLY